MDLRQSWPVVFACLFGGVMVAGTQEHVSAEEEMTHPAKATFAGGCFWCMEGPFDQPVPYTLYRIGSGREAFLKRVWGEAAH